MAEDCASLLTADDDLLVVDLLFFAFSKVDSS